MKPEYGMCLKVEGIGYVDTRPIKDLHTVKQRAGKIFHREEVKSVCVHDDKGIAHLYLKKTPEGIIREEL
jgi:hypothetical protein